MQSIATNQYNISRDEKVMEVLSYIILLPQKWKKNQKMSNDIVNKYSKILEQIFILPSNNFNVLLLLEKFIKSTPNYEFTYTKIKDFLYDLLCLSINFQSIFEFLLKFFSCKSSNFILFFEKNDLSDLLLDFLFQKENFSDKKIFDQTIQLIDQFLSDIQIDSILFNSIFKTFGNSKQKFIQCDDDEFQLNSGSYFSHINFETNIFHILDLSLLNDSHAGIDFVLSIHARLSLSNSFSLYSINHPETIKKLYHFLEQKINYKQFDHSTVSAILLLTSMMNNIYHMPNNFFKLLKKDEQQIIKQEFQKKNDEEKKDDLEFFSQILNDLQFLYNFDSNKKESENVEENNNGNDSKNDAFFSGIPPPIYQDNSNDFIIQKTSNYSPMSFRRNKRNSHFFPSINKQRKDLRKGFGKLSQCDPNYFSLGAIQDEKAIAPLFPSPYKTYQQFEVNTNTFHSQLKDYSKSDAEEHQKNLELKKEIDKNKNKKVEINQNKDESINGNDQNQNEENDQNKNEENDQNKNEESKEENFEQDDKTSNKKRICHTNLKDKDILELVNSTNTNNNIDLNEMHARKRTPLIPAIPTKQNQPKKPGRIRTLSSLNNIYGNNSLIHSYEQVENNSGYSSNYYRASISSSQSFGNVLQSNRRKSNFTVTTGLGAANFNSKTDLILKKRNSYDYISPLKPLYESSQSSTEYFGNNTIHASHSASQYDYDIFPTTFIESVNPEYSKEVNFNKNAETQNQVNQTINEEDKTIENIKENEKNDDIKESHENETKIDYNRKENDSLLTCNEKFVDNFPAHSADEKNKTDSLSDIDNSPEFFDDMDITPIPREKIRRLNVKKRPGSSDFFKNKFPKKTRTSLPPSSVKFNLPKVNQEISLIDLATSSEALNYDDFNVGTNKRMSPFSMNKGGLVHSTSGPIQRVVCPGILSPLRKSLGSIPAQKNPVLDSSSGSNQYYSSNEKLLSNVNDENDSKSNNFDKIDEIGGIHNSLSSINEIADESQKKQQLEMINEEQDQNNLQHISPLLAIIEENNVQQQPLLDTITEESDGCQHQPFQLDVITEEADSNQQFSPLETITEETDSNQQFSPLETIAEETINNQQFSSLETITEETDNNQQFSPLETITEETDNNQQFSSLETIAEETDNNQQFSSLETIAEETDNNQQFSPLETITEETDNNQQFSPLETITEETDNNQQVSPLETITEEADGNQQSLLLETITEETDNNQQFSPLETITEESNQLQSNQMQPLESITEENWQQPYQLETISEDFDENQEQSILTAITEEYEGNNYMQLDTITEEIDNDEQHQNSPLETINEEANNYQQQQISPFESIMEESEENQPVQLDAIPEEIPQKQQFSQLETIAEESDSNTNHPLTKQSSGTETVRQIESNLFVSIGVLLANNLFIENSSRLLQNSICIYLCSLDSCAALFDKVLSESNIVMQIIKLKKENRLLNRNEVDDDDENESSFSFGQIPKISKIISKNHESIPMQFKSQWNEYMNNEIKENEGKIQTSDQSIHSFPLFD